MASTERCENCNAPTANPENDFGEFVCDGCEQNAAEAAYERMCEDFHDGGSTAPWPDVVRQRMIEARKLK